jgi:RNA polymerase sigma-70 factor (ECF subfamily)
MHDAAMVIDQRARYEELYRTHGAALWRSVLLYAGDPDVASDAVAEAFAQAIRRGEDIETPRAWITRAAFRIAAGDLKDRRTRAYPIVDVGYEMPESVAGLADALAELSPKQRAAAVLHFRDGYTAAEVAEIIGSTTSAVGVHLHRAKARLRELLGDDDD